MHLAATLPEEVEIGAVEVRDWNTEVVTTVGGFEVRNAPWSTPLRRWEVSFPVSERDDAIYTAVLDLFELAQGSRHSFNFRSWTDGDPGPFRAVRFDGPIEISGVTPDLDHIVGITLVEVRV